MSLLTGKANTKNMNNYMTITNNSSLTNEPIDLLYKCARNHFQFGGYNSLDILLSELGVEVHIEPGIHIRQIPTSLDEAINHWDKISKEEYAKRRKGLSTPERYFEIEKKLGELKKERGDILNMPLRGEYDPTNNVIILYPEEMMQEYGGQYMDELLVSTFAHEAMHAYFNRPGHKRYPYVLTVEEPLAEFGMLLYLHETQSQDLYEWAYDDVKSKTTCYKYGANLMDQYLSETKQGMPSPTRQYLEAYKINLNKCDMPQVVNKNNGQITLPSQPKWRNVFKKQPRYFYDPDTNALGLDGDWCEVRQWDDNHPDLDILVDIRILSHSIGKLYLGDNFITNEMSSHILDLLSKADVDVSPKNKTLYVQNGIPLFKSDNKPLLFEISIGFYEVSKNGKRGIIDAQLNTVVSIIYDDIESLDRNGLFKVKNDGKYGLVNKQGNEQVACEYDEISLRTNNTYAVKKDGKSFIINKDGNPA